MKRTILRALLLSAIVLAMHHANIESYSRVSAQDPFVDDPEPAPEPHPGIVNGAAPELLPELTPEVMDGPYAEMPYAYGQQPDLFYNYYAAPNAGGVPAQMYIAPRPVPARVGHTYYTYQPLYPHEYMYPHYREYYTYYGNYHHYGCANSIDSLNRTSVRYQRGNLSSLYYYPLFRYVPGMPKCIGGRCR